MNRAEDAICYTAGAIGLLGALYALWPRIAPLLPLLAFIAAGAVLVAALERWAKRPAMPPSVDEQRREALARYRAAHGAHELAAKCVAGLRFQQQLKNRGSNR